MALLVEFPWESFAMLGKLILRSLTFLGTFIFYSLAFLGKFMSCSILAVSSIVSGIVGFVTLSCVTCFENVQDIFRTVALFVVDLGGTILPYMWKAAFCLLALMQSAVGCTLYGVFDVTSAVMEIGIKVPFWTGLVLGVVTALVGVYYKELWALFSGMKNASVSAIISSRNFVFQSVESRIAYVRFLFRAFLQFLTRWCIQFRLAAPRPKPAQATAAGPDDAPMPSRGPSIFSLCKKMESVEQLERLKNDVRELRTNREEERESKLYVICRSNFRAVVVMPCKHFTTCEECMALLPVNVFDRKGCLSHSNQFDIQSVPVKASVKLDCQLWLWILAEFAVFLFRTLLKLLFIVVLSVCFLVPVR